MNIQKLAWHDLQWCLRRAPRPVLALMKKHGEKLMIAGGYIRACIANDHINDVDLFVSDKEFAKAVALELVEGDEKRIHATENAYTVRGYKLPIQIIHRWIFQSPEQCLLSFDFTIARAAFWWKQDIVPAPTDEKPDATIDKGIWLSACDPRFYPDLAGKRLIYCSPIREEEAGGSFLRVLKFYQRDYRIPLDSMAAVITRLLSGVRWEECMDRGTTRVRLRDIGIDEEKLTRVITGLLREVDPNIDPSHIAHLPAEKVDGRQEEPADA